MVSVYLMTHLESYVGMPCPYCYDKMTRDVRKKPTREHIYPKSKGGTLERGNKTVVCYECNTLKGDMTIEEFYDWLKTRKDIKSQWRVICVREFYVRWERTQRVLSNRIFPREIDLNEYFIPDYIE